MEGIPPVVAVLLADTKEFSAKIDEAGAKMEELGGASTVAGGKFGAFASKASTAVIGVGVAIAAYGIDKAIKFQTALDEVQNTTNATASTIDKISKSAVNLSNNTTSSATSIVQAYQAVEAAGYKWAAAHKAVTAASKLAQISGNDVVTTTQALISAQNLGVTQGMSAAKVADLLTIALKGNESGLAGVVSLLTGKVGAAFAGYKQSAGEAVAVANEFSLAGITQVRQIATFVNKLGALKGPMTTFSIIDGKAETSSAGWVNALVSVGLSATKTRDAFAGPDGLINGLKYLQTVAGGSTTKLQNYLSAVFGATGVGPGMALIKHLPQLINSVNKANAATGKGLNTAFGISQQDVDNQLAELKNKFENVLQGIGMFLLPGVTDLAKWSNDAVNFFEAHPLLKKIASDSAIALFAAAVALKLGHAISKVFSALGNVAGKVISKVSGGGAPESASTSLDYLKIIADNTTRIAESTGISAKEGGVGDTEGGAGDVGLLGAAGGLGGAGIIEGLGGTGAGIAALGTFGTAIVAFGTGVAAFKITSDLLQTSIGKKVGNVITAGGELNPINDLAGAIAGLTGRLAHPTAQINAKTLAKDKYDIAHPKSKGKVTINTKITQVLR